MSRAIKTAALAALSVLLVLGVGAASSAVRETQTKDIPVSPGGLLTINLEAGGWVEILGADVTTAKVEYSVQADEAEYFDIAVNPTTGGLEIRNTLKRRNVNTHRVDFKITLPKKFNVELDSMGGGLTIENLEGTFSGKTMGGELVLRGVRGRARLTTMGGEIKLTDSELDGYLKTMGGKVLFRNVTGEVDGSSMGGLVRYENVKDRDGRYRAPERISESGLTAKTVVLSTMGGRIDVDDALEGAKVHTMGGPIRIFNARKFVQATTMGGDVRIKVKEGWIDATTMGGDITADVETGLGAGDKGVHLESKSGDIVLTIPAGLPLKFDLTIAYTKSSDQNYKIVSDFPVEEERTRNWEYPERGGGEGNARKYIYGKGSIGAGTIAVVIETVNGNITIRKAR
ncbi:MAG: DUF4097 domain-containing protein [Candidatus Aminicenantes bacterium]|nr:DUF4097 domain-containing protein [Candidatus Aminicenantes bacterium]